MTLLITLGKFFFRYRNVLFPLFFISALIFTEPRYPLGDKSLDTVLDVIGFLVALSGQIIRALTIGYDYIQRGGKNKQVYANRLVQGGMFAISRNPLYLGNGLIFLGVALMFNAPALYWGGIPLLLLVYGSIIAAEEQYLLGKFGAEYQDYCQRVNRLWPRWKGFTHAIGSMAFDWKRLVSKEHGTTFGWLLMAIAVELWEEYLINGPNYFHHDTARLLIALFVSGALTYAGVHYAKKMGAFSKA